MNVSGTPLAEGVRQTSRQSLHHALVLDTGSGHQVTTLDQLVHKLNGEFECSSNCSLNLWLVMTSYDVECCILKAFRAVRESHPSKSAKQGTEPLMPTKTPRCAESILTWLGGKSPAGSTEIGQVCTAFFSVALPVLACSQHLPTPSNLSSRKAKITSKISKSSAFLDIFQAFFRVSYARYALLFGHVFLFPGLFPGLPGANAVKKKRWPCDLSPWRSSALDPCPSRPLLHNWHTVTYPLVICYIAMENHHL